MRHEDGGVYLRPGAPGTEEGRIPFASGTGDLAQAGGVVQAEGLAATQPAIADAPRSAAVQADGGETRGSPPVQEADDFLIEN